jgi:uncharacterized membrane protein YbhN (UPF0104 family)
LHETKQYFLPKKIKIFFNYFLAPILLLWLGINLYQQIIQQKNNTESWQTVKNAFGGIQVWKLIVATVLVIANWSIEAIKWQLVMKPLQSFNFITAFKATLAGTSFAANTPNRVGEYFGRMIYVEEGKRLQSIPLTITASCSQLIVTLVMGSIGLILYKSDPIASQSNSIWLNTLLIGTIAVTIIAVLLYFKLSFLLNLLKRIPFVNKYAFFINKIDELQPSTLTKLLLYSTLRYTVFIIQYVLVLEAFGVVLPLYQVVFSLLVMFLVLAIIPSFVILEAGVRGKVSVEVFKVFTTNTIGVMAAGYFIWLINLMLPALLGVLLLIGRRVFKK